MNTQLQRLFQWAGSSDPNARKDWGQEKGPTEDEMVGWHHWHNGHEFEQTPRDSEGQGSLVCCSPRGCKESDTTERPNNKGTHTIAAFSPVDSRAGGVEAGGQTSQEVTTAKLWHLNSEAHLPTKKKKNHLRTLWWPFWWPEWVSQQLWNQQHSQRPAGFPSGLGATSTIAGKEKRRWGSKCPKTWELYFPLWWLLSCAAG